MCKTVVVFFLICLLKSIDFGVLSLDPLIVSEINSLSELPLNKLLQVRNSWQSNEMTNVEELKINGEDEFLVPLDESQPQALHVKRKFAKDRDGSYESAPWQKKGDGSNKKSLSTIFQITITSLAFLAFGGYLLCLLVQAIKDKQTIMTTATTTTTTTMSNSDAILLANFKKKKRRPGYRHRRNVIWPETDPESLYQALRMFSEGYATYYTTIDYKYYNFTVDTLS